MARLWEGPKGVATEVGTIGTVQNNLYAKRGKAVPAILYISPFKSIVNLDMTQAFDKLLTRIVSPTTQY
jgi:hypothetical protein